MEENTIISDEGTIYQAKPTEQCKKPVMPGDYFFSSKKQSPLFIKIAESKTSKKEIDQYIDKKVAIEYEIKTGSWREKNNLNSNQKYMVIHSIKNTNI